MPCPQCQGSDTKVTDSRARGEGTIARRRTCVACAKRFTTLETYADQLTTQHSLSEMDRQLQAMTAEVRARIGNIELAIVALTARPARPPAWPKNTQREAAAHLKDQTHG